MGARRRGTAIVETEKGILLVAGKSKKFITPGGGANRGETRFQAAIRELYEETGLKAYEVKVIFRYKKISQSGKHDEDHIVVLIKASGTPKPKSEVKYIGFYKPGCSLNVSKNTMKIIEKYYEWKKNKLIQHRTN